MREILIALSLLIGGSFVLIGAVGLVRLPDLLMRLHGPTKATTLGVGSILIGSMLHFSGQGNGLSLQEMLITLFLFTTAPVSAHLVAKTMRHTQQRKRGVRS